MRAKLMALVGLLLAALVLAASSVSADPQPDKTAGSTAYAVRLSPAAAKARGLRPDFPWITVAANSPEQAKRDTADAELVEPVYIMTVQGQPNDVDARQTAELALMRVPDAWNLTTGSNRVVVAIFDTGIDPTHPDLKSKYLGGRDWVDGDTNPIDEHGHGTHVAGIAAAATNNGTGIAGVGYDSRIVAIRVLNAQGSGASDLIARALVELADTAAKQTGWHYVANFSLGCQCQSSQFQDAARYAWARGVLLIAAAGNSNSNAYFEPAAIPEFIGVGATDNNGVKASFSNYGQNVDMAAPGVQIYSTLRGGSYGPMSGTSMASPNLSGVAALVWGAHPDWTNAQVKAALLGTARKIGDANYYGAGMVDAAAAVKYGGSVPTPQPTTRPTPGPTPTPIPNPGDKSRELVRLINEERARQGLPPFAIDNQLERIATEHNTVEEACADRYGYYTPGCFAHQVTLLGEPKVEDRLLSAGYVWGSENIGKSYLTPTDMVNAWMNSTGHRANILGPYNFVGCSWLDAANGHWMGLYQTCAFGRR